MCRKSWNEKILNLWGYNSKLEFVILFLSTVTIILWFVCRPIRVVLQPIADSFPAYFSTDRISNLTSVFAITIGVYIAVISILATSVIGISEELIKGKIDKSLLFITEMGCIENLTAVILGATIPIQILPWPFLYIGLLVASAISFIKFLKVIFLIFQCNMGKMAESIDRESADKQGFLLKLDNIERYLKDIKDYHTPKHEK